MSMISDLADYLVDQSIGDEVGADVYYNYMPDLGTSNTVIGIFDTGGFEPDIYIPTYERTFQVYVRAVSYAAGEAKLKAIRDLLHQKLNVTIGSTYFYFIFAQSEGGPVTEGRESGGRGLIELSINFRTRTR